MANRNSLTDFLVDLTGTCGYALIHSVKKDKKGIPTSSFFFKPYRSMGDFGMRAITPITAPGAFTLEAVTMAVVALYKVLEALYYTCTSHKELAREAANHFLICAAIAITSFLAALVSPAVNFIDLIGGGINSLRGQQAEATEQPAFR